MAGLPPICAVMVPSIMTEGAAVIYSIWAFFPGRSSVISRIGVFTMYFLILLNHQIVVRIGGYAPYHSVRVSFGWLLIVKRINTPRCSNGIRLVDSRFTPFTVVFRKTSNDVG
jgi:hypothetical protein